MNDERLTINQSGLSSMVFLIIVVLSVVVVWEISQFTTQFSAPKQLSKSGSGANCVGGPDARDCNDTDEGSGPISSAGLPKASPETEVFGWKDDGKP